MSILRMRASCQTVRLPFRLCIVRESSQLSWVLGRCEWRKQRPKQRPPSLPKERVDNTANGLAADGNVSIDLGSSERGNGGHRVEGGAGV